MIEILFDLPASKLKSIKITKNLELKIHFRNSIDSQTYDRIFRETLIEPFCFFPGILDFSRHYASINYEIDGEIAPLHVDTFLVSFRAILTTFNGIKLLDAKEREILEKFIDAFEDNQIKCNEFINPVTLTELCHYSYGSNANESLKENIERRVRSRIPNDATARGKHAIEMNIGIIWYDKLPTNAHIANWKNWMKQNPSWNLHILYDPDLLSQEHVYQFQDFANKIGFKLHHYEDIIGYDPLSVIHTAGPFSNPARRADRDRVVFLIKIGGLWIDAGDVQPLLKLPTPMYAKHGVLFNNCVQLNNSEINPKKTSINNNIMAAAKDNPVMDEYRKAMQEHEKIYYRLPKDIHDLRYNARDETIIHHGPIFLREFLTSKKLITPGKPDTKYGGFQPVLDPEWRINNTRFKSRFDLSWLTFNKKDEPLLPRKKYLSPDAHYDDIIKRVAYEEEIFTNSLFEDYLYDYLLHHYPVTQEKQRFENEYFIQQLFAWIDQNDFETNYYVALNEIIERIVLHDTNDAEKDLLMRLTVRNLQVKQLKLLKSILEKETIKSVSFFSKSADTNETIKKILESIHSAEKGEISPQSALEMITKKMNKIYCSNEIKDFVDECHVLFGAWCNLIGGKRNLSI